MNAQHAFKTELWRKEIAELAHRVQEGKYPLISEADSRPNVTPCELTISVKLQDQRAEQELVKDERIQQADNELASRLQERVKGALEQV